MLSFGHAVILMLQLLLMISSDAAMMFFLVRTIELLSKDIFWSMMVTCIAHRVTNGMNFVMHFYQNHKTVFNRSFLFNN